MRVLVLVLPLPDALDELFAAEIVAGLLLFLEQPPLDHGLRGDAGVIGAGHPEGVVALHPLAANENVLQRVVERVPEVQRAGDVRRRNDDRERLAAWIGRARCGSSRVRSPEVVPLALARLGVVDIAWGVLRQVPCSIASYDCVWPSRFVKRLCVSSRKAPTLRSC